MTAPRIFADAPGDQLDQGDVFAEIEVSDHDGRGAGRANKTVMLLSHGCEIDKPDLPTLLCALVGDIRSINVSRAGDLRAGRVINAMHLPAEVSGLPEGYVDFRSIYRVPRSIIQASIASGRRLVCMTELGRNALGAFLYRFFTRRLPQGAEPTA